MKKQIVMVMVVSVLFLSSLTVPVMAVSTNGKFSQMPAYYDDTIFTITFQELPPKAEAKVLAKNKSINIIYQSDQAGDLCGLEFISVIDAIQGDGFNPLWQEVQIVFPDCESVVQFTSDDDILAARDAGLIQLIPTTEVYICAVVGPGPKKP